MKKYTIPLIVIAVLGLFALGIRVSANPIIFSKEQSTSSATSSGQAIAASGTYSLTFDSYASSVNYGPNDVALLIQATAASSTASVLSIAINYSQDGVDWYEDNYGLYEASTTPNLEPERTYTWTPGTTSRVNKALKIDAPTRYVRATFSATGATTTIWASFQPRRDTN